MAASPIKAGVYWIQNIRTKTVVDLQDGSSANNTPLQGMKKRELDDDLVPSQLWIIAPSTPQGAYTLQNANGRSYATIHEGLAANGTPIEGMQPGASVTGDSNKWTITLTADGAAYNIRNVESGTYMDLRGGGASDGTVIQGWAAALTANQHWLIVSP